MLWRKDPRAEVAPGVESPDAFTARVVRALTRLTAAHAGKNVVIVCHGGVIANAALFFLGLDTVACASVPMYYPRPEYRDLVGRPWLTAFGTDRGSVANTSITHWRLLQHPHLGPVWEQGTFNDALHLRDLDSEERINWAAIAPASAAHAGSARATPAAAVR